MLSKRYIYKSNQLRDRYAEGFIEDEEYTSSLEAIKEEELASLPLGYDKKPKQDEIYGFEEEQFSLVEQMRTAEEQRKKKQEEEERIKSLTPEQKLYEEREKYYKEVIPRLIDEYKRESKRYRDKHNRLQWLVIIGSAVVTSTTGVTIFTNIEMVSYISPIPTAPHAVCFLQIVHVYGTTSVSMNFYRQRARKAPSFMASSIKDTNHQDR